jgi:hypothetical protein
MYDRCQHFHVQNTLASSLTRTHYSQRPNICFNSRELQEIVSQSEIRRHQMTRCIRTPLPPVRPSQLMLQMRMMAPTTTSMTRSSRMTRPIIDAHRDDPADRARERDAIHDDDATRAHVAPQRVQRRRQPRHRRCRSRPRSPPAHYPRQPTR